MKQKHETHRLILRNWLESDLEPFFKLNSDPNVMEFMPNLLTREQSDEMAKSISNEFKLNGFGLWALEIKETGKFIGFTGLNRPKFASHFTPCVEVGWRIQYESWGNGYATEAAQKALEIGFDKFDLEQIVSFTVPQNVRSINVMKKLGMTYDSKDDFDHPKLNIGHHLRRHVLFRLNKNELRNPL